MSKTVNTNFKKTTWYNDLPPAIDADQLNRLEEAIGDLYYRVFGTDNDVSIIQNNDEDARYTLIHALNCINLILKELGIEVDNVGSSLTTTSKIDEIQSSVPTIVDNLTTYESNMGLSAKQGANLNESIINLTKELNDKVGLIDDKYMLIEQYVQDKSTSRVKDSAKLNGKEASSYVLKTNHEADIRNLEQKISSSSVQWRTFDSNGLEE